MKIEQLLRPNIRDLKPYTSAWDEFKANEFLKLDANENPNESGFNRYPDPYQTELKQALSNRKKLDDEQLVLGNGSDELIDLLIRAFCEPGKENVVGVKPSYGMYKVCCDINNVQYKEVALNQDFQLDAKKLLEQTNQSTKLIFLCSPNNPTGNCLEQAEIEYLLENFKGIVVIDEAYIDFATTETWSKKTAEYQNLVVLQTLSKAYGMASLRLGMAWCSTEMVKVFNKIKPPYNVNGLSQEKALSLLKKEKQFIQEVNEAIRERNRLEIELSKLKCVQKVFPSEANFLLLRMINADSAYEHLIRNGIVVRNRSKQYGCENCLRISIGTVVENNILLKTIKTYENEKSTIYR